MKKTILIISLLALSVQGFAQLTIDIINRSEYPVTGFAVVVPNVTKSAASDTLYSTRLMGKNGLAMLDKISAAGIYELLIVNEKQPLTSLKFAYDNAPAKAGFTILPETLDFNWNDKLNQDFQKFNVSGETYMNEIRTLYSPASAYPYKSSEIYSEILNRYQTAKKNYNALYDSLSSFPSRKLSAALRASRQYIPEPGTPEEEFLKQSREFAERNFSFKNPALHDQQVYVDKLMEALSMIMYDDKRPRTRTMSDDVGEFISTKLPVGTKRYSYDVEAIHQILLQYGFDAEAEYVEVNFKARLPENKNNRALQERLKNYRSLAIGNQAPDFGYEIKGKQGSLYEIQAPKTVIAFWAPWCHECQRILPAVTAVENKYPDVVFVGVGLEKDMAVWEEAAKAHPKWVQLIAQGNGENRWDDPLVKLYGVQGIPLFIVLDKDKKILGRAGSAEMLDELLAK